VQSVIINSKNITQTKYTAVAADV